MGGEHPEWLPAGWKVRVKARSSGKKDKYYINPANSLKFSSKLEVLHYLESSVKNDNPNDPNMLCAEAEGQLSINDNVDELGKSGLKLATDVKCDATNVAKGQMPINQKEDKSLLCNEMVKSGSKAALLRTGERRRSPRLAANKLKDHAIEGSSSSQTGNAVQNTSTTTAPPMTNRSIATENEQISAEGHEGSSLSAQSRKSKGSKRKLTSDFPRRTSKRLAGVKVNMEACLLRPAKATCKAVMASNELKLNSERIDNDDQKMPSIVSEAANNNEQKMPQIDTEQKTDDGNKEEGNCGKNNDEKLQQVLMKDPCIAFAVKILTGEIPVENFIKAGGDAVKSHSQSPAVGDQGQGQGQRKDLQ
ncbi:uncharacterized protein LOC127256392 isoform X2 [Andrographis paniculata]|uniref:uncharacterized protein LOC127256392 isoform X2 n=1 Tax=Andrographis paniculata TaxID=175694 RepID=UPI0021E84CB5|nr:uncharacterized protein LOC127256392 isoform X2 [Andrographis paniculata]